MTRRLVVDANRIFSAILKDGETRRAMMSTGAAIFAPRFLRIEIERHKETMVRRCKGRREDIEAVLAVLYRRIGWVGDGEILPHLPEARAALQTRDPKDVPYLACALAVQADAIWSSDTDFDAQGLVPRVAHPDAKIPVRQTR